MNKYYVIKLGFSHKILKQKNNTFKVFLVHQNKWSSILSSQMIKTIKSKIEEELPASSLTEARQIANILGYVI